MITRSLKQVAEMIGLEASGEGMDESIVHGVTIDSRKIEKGHLFVPFKGENTDGHQYVEAAIKEGAAAALWQKDVPNPPQNVPLLFVEDTLESLQQLAKSYLKELKVKVVGITGSNGKTSTKDITTSLLSLHYKVQKTEGNYNNHLGMPLTILKLEEDTDIAVLEMGMSGRGEIDFLSRLAEPDVVVITNIGESHLLDLGSREGIAEAKLEILHGLKPGGRLIYFGDEPLLSDKIATMNNANIDIKTFGFLGTNSLFPKEIHQLEQGSTFLMNENKEEYNLPILGNHNVLNALAGMLVADYFQIPYTEMNKGLQTLKLTNMRMELLEGKDGVKVINDAYNASPTSMLAAIHVLNNLPGFKQKIIVLGDMLELGPNEENYHIQLGESLTPNEIDLAFTYGNLGQYIAKGAKNNYPEEKVFHFFDKTELIHSLQEKIDSETVVLVKASRGMKLEEVVKALL